MQCRNLVTQLWLDSKVVTVMSMNSQPTEKGTVKWRQNDEKRVDVLYPEAIIKYNRFMGVWTEMTSSAPSVM